MDDFNEEQWNPLRYFRGILRDESEKEAPTAFRSYLGIVASPPKDFTAFSRRVNNFMEKEPFNFPNPLAKFGGYKKIRIEAAYLYDAVTLYAKAVRDILTEIEFHSNDENNNGSVVTKSAEMMLSRVSNGKIVSQKLRNIRYQSATGHETKMDENGEAEGNFTLVTLKSQEGTFGVYPVGFFMHSSSEFPVSGSCIIFLSY